MKEYYKKIDKSFFDGKVTIPNNYIDCFIELDELINGNNRDIIILFNRKKI